RAERLRTAAAERAHQWTETAREKTADLARLAREQTQELGRRAKTGFAQAKSRARHIGREYPLHVALSAGAVGFLLGVGSRIRRAKREQSKIFRRTSGRGQAGTQRVRSHTNRNSQG